MTKLTKIFISSITLLTVMFSGQSQTIVSVVNHVENEGYKNEYEKKILQKNEKVNYELWEVLLQKNVSPEGTVNYEGFKNDSEKFNDFLRELARVRINSTWSKNDKMAFWINVYNAYTVKLITNHYPLASIKEIDNPWKQKFFSINGNLMDLSQVEHEILRGFGDPRIHFAINCASASCPRLIQVPYRASNLERLLERQTKEFINDPFYNTITSYTARVSKLFDWYKRDFKQDSGSTVNFINKYSDVNIKDQEDKGYKSYDWSINSKK